MKSSFLGLTLATLLFAYLAPAAAAKPEWAGQGHGKKHQEQHEKAPEVQIGSYFHEDQRHAAVRFYGEQQSKGHCPPGLAKKKNGCQPPGQAKKWSKGQPLPRDLTRYPVPKEVLVKIGVPPAGYRYVRVANDLLLIAIGTSMVVDAIEDLIRP
ncbi:MAG: hypothetical protein K9K38_04215 [Rhodoferax sp.]|nr:hypothetical protein [Rhodoferax sp.]MCF8208598.1 hypothetical protein [Rhodoferax sp.]